MVNPLKTIPPARDLNLEMFSGREREIITRLADGQRMQDIADQLRLTINTVKDYVKTIYSKTQVHSARELLVKLYNDPELPRQQQRYAELLQSLERVLAAPHPDLILHELVAGVRQVINTSRAGVWRLAELRGRTVMIPAAGGPLVGLESSAFVQRVARCGWTLHQPVRASERDPITQATQELAALGLENHVLGICVRGLVLAATMRLDLPEGTGMLLVSKGDGQPFSEAEIMYCKVLTRVAETYCGTLARCASA